MPLFKSVLASNGLGVHDTLDLIGDERKARYFLAMAGFDHVIVSFLPHELYNCQTLHFPCHAWSPFRSKAQIHSSIAIVYKKGSMLDIVARRLAVRSQVAHVTAYAAMVSVRTIYVVYNMNNSLSIGHSPSEKASVKKASITSDHGA